MRETIETIAISDDYRVAVSYDEMLDCPLAWNDEINAHTISVGQDYMTMKQLGACDAEGDDIQSVIDALEEFTDSTSDEVAEAVLKHLKRKGYAARISEVGGRGSWHFAVFYARPDGGDVNAWINGNIRTFEQWRDGEVYTLVLQRRTTWTNDRGETRETWETEEACGGYYFDSYEDMETQAREFANDFMPDTAPNAATV